MGASAREKPIDKVQGLNGCGTAPMVDLHPPLHLSADATRYARRYVHGQELVRKLGKGCERLADRVRHFSSLT
jgi:hypothetical protein